jgi:EAL domain-containing protein (putative c-di-GMP-specific phosphodiesterase class I)
MAAGRSRICGAGAAGAERNSLAPRQLELELTERVLIDNGGEVQSVLAQLRGMGVGISLDDFGTGYSSLSYLTQFHLNTLKIDRAFVMNIEHSERSNNLVHAIIAMGHSLGLQLVAEGVETAGQASICASSAATICRAIIFRGRYRRMNCRPLPAA